MARCLHGFPGLASNGFSTALLHNVQWYGRGPQENYPDRKSGYRIGEYQIDSCRNV